ncbi:MAG TPA: DUF6249 domain-containing protein [Anaeromyxobacteraceae bacterium]|nr:DUF6249 domain-containing protein [Anaeromyxobacteraceae bacterium]
MKRTLLPVLLALAPAIARADGADVVAPIFVTGLVFGFSFLIVAASLYAGHRRAQLRHETIRAALEKGIPIPRELLDPPRTADPQRDLKRGILLLALGIGLGTFLGVADPGKPSWALGFVFALLGVGFLVSWRLLRRSGPAGGDPAAG